MLELNEQQRGILCADMLQDFSDVQQDQFFELCETANLNPFMKQIYAMKQGGRLVPMVSIDGLRSIAQRTEQYAGQTKTEWCGTDGEWKDVWFALTPPAACRVGVMRTGFTEPLFAVSTWKENGGSTPVWKKMPCLMLAKTAEAMALRKAFPNETVGLYVDSEVKPDIEPSQDVAIASTSVSDRIMGNLEPEPETEPEPAIEAAEPESPSDKCFSQQEIENWLYPLMKSVSKGIEDLRVAMRRARSIDKSAVELEPTQWPVIWQKRIEAWAKSQKVEVEA